MNANKAFETSDPKETVAFYEALIRRGTVGQVAFGLFRAQKRSSRAKGYRSGRFRSKSYDSKNEALRYLNAALQGESSLSWGWGLDNMQDMHCHVLYVDLPFGQVSFHSASNHGGPEYRGVWDGMRGVAEERVAAFCDAVLEMPKSEVGEWLLMPFGKHCGSSALSVDVGYAQWLLKWPGIEGWPLIRSIAWKVANEKEEQRSDVPQDAERADADREG